MKVKESMDILNFFTTLFQAGILLCHIRDTYGDPNKVYAIYVRSNLFIDRQYQLRWVLGMWGEGPSRFPQWSPTSRLELHHTNLTDAPLSSLFRRTAKPCSGPKAGVGLSHRRWLGQAKEVAGHTTIKALSEVVHCQRFPDRGAEARTRIGRRLAWHENICKSWKSVMTPWLCWVVI
jgi:hypothetical protein